MHLVRLGLVHPGNVRPRVGYEAPRREAPRRQVEDAWEQAVLLRLQRQERLRGDLPLRPITYMRVLPKHASHHGLQEEYASFAHRQAATSTDHNKRGMYSHKGGGKKGGGKKGGRG